ncbi:sensor domain-containing diguanylate cyclase [Oceanospirillum sediminis]|uniref:diguanylate cyclase n=1 Tax=Oceanospirillum sediminis TaxID=2760088 RepID=A0A839IUP7_9GAMM|nr:GGDEF domain-containing protein [Oceanospirillum sediminis]MBB1488199.1 diguanylate cyclase [Oceanospirillum sediminis]
MEQEYPKDMPLKELTLAFHPNDEVTFFKYAVELAGDEVFLMKADSQIVYVNRSACDHLGYDYDELIGMHVWEWDPLVSREVWPSIWERTKRDKLLHIETQHRTKSGRIFPVEIRGHYYQFKGEEFLLAFAYDITDRKKEEKALLDYQKQLEEEVQKRTTELNAAIDKLQNLASIDGLTKIFNRRMFNESIEAEWTRLAESGGELSFIIIDIDFFKHYNDSYGHLQGDACLIQIADILKNSVQRPGDVIARYGGEEFACILPDTSLEEALSVAHSIQAFVSDCKIIHEKSLVSPFITLSIGVASCYPKDLLNYSYLISMADEYLYQAKREGRNRICSCQVN